MSVFIGISIEKHLELERLYNSSVTRIKCQVIGGIKDNSRDATDWMEWQANALTPKIQMPIAMFKTQALIGKTFVVRIIDNPFHVL